MLNEWDRKLEGEAEVEAAKVARAAVVRGKEATEAAAEAEARREEEVAAEAAEAPPTRTLESRPRRQRGRATRLP